MSFPKSTYTCSTYELPSDQDRLCLNLVRSLTLMQKRPSMNHEHGEHITYLLTSVVMTELRYGSLDELLSVAYKSLARNDLYSQHSESQHTIQRE